MPATLEIPKVPAEPSSSMSAAVDLDSLAERVLVRLGRRGLEFADEQLAKPGKMDRGTVALLVSLVTLSGFIAFWVAHELGNSKFEDAIEGLIDVLEHQNPESGKALRDVERNMHR